MVANKLRRRLTDAWEIVVVDHDDDHLYQPGLLTVPFGDTDPERLVRSRRAQLAPGVGFEVADVDRVDPDAHEVRFTDGRTIGYDRLVIASGTRPCPEEVPGTLGRWWRSRIFDFYTLEGAAALRAALADFDEGRLVVHVTDMPIKCPVAPLEFVFLADAFLRDHGRRERVDLVYVTPSRTPSPSPWHHATCATCWRSAGSGSRPTSWSRGSTSRPRR
jgi:sulfide:quinone oxidoreductase